MWLEFKNKKYLGQTINRNYFNLIDTKIRGILVLNFKSIKNLQYYKNVLPSDYISVVKTQYHSDGIQSEKVNKKIFNYLSIQERKKLLTQIPLPKPVG